MCDFTVLVCTYLATLATSAQASLLRGEALQAEPLDLSVSVAKSFHGGTATSQPCDAGSTLRGSEAVRKHLRDGDTVSQALRRRAQAVLKLHSTEVISSEGQSSEEKRGEGSKSERGGSGYSY